jgi:hypothetical protein
MKKIMYVCKMLTALNFKTLQLEPHCMSSKEKENKEIINV